MSKAIGVTAITTTSIFATIMVAIIATLAMIEVGPDIQVGTTTADIPLAMSNKWMPGPVCSAIAGAEVLEHLGAASGIHEMARMYYDTRADNDLIGGRFMHHVAEAIIEVSPELRRKPARHHNVHDLVAYMRSHNYRAAIVSMDHPGWHHAVAVLVDRDGFTVVDTAMAKKTFLGRMNTTPTDSWNGDIRQYPDAVGVWIIHSEDQAKSA